MKNFLEKIGIKNSSPEILARKKLNLLEEKYPRNSLFKKEFIGIPENFVSVFHSTKEASLESILKDGLDASKKIQNPVFDTEIQKRNSHKEKIEDIFAEVEPENFNRKKSTFASIDSINHWGMQDDKILLEIKVDPEKILVADGDYFTEASCAASDEDAKDWAREYWKTAISLSDFIKLSEHEKETIFLKPEVIIPYVVPEKEIRICKVIEKTS